jgi:hypothetical protein
VNTAPQPPPRRHRRGLLDWLFNWGGDDNNNGDDNSSDDDSNRHRHRSDNSTRELAPRAVQEGNGRWQRVPGGRPNYPPSNAAIPPPDTPPPPRGDD